MISNSKKRLNELQKLTKLAQEHKEHNGEEFANQVFEHLIDEIASQYLK